MKVWLIKDGEILPIQANTRKMRTGMLAAELVKQGHDVTWWASTFSHQQKSLLYSDDTEIILQDNYKIKLLHAGEYKKNISLARLRHHRKLARRMAEKFKRSETPDIIVCSFPIIETAYLAIQFAKQHSVPIIIDIRDIWPDLYLAKTPSYLRLFVRSFFHASFAQTKKIFQQANGLAAISQGLLQWGLDYADREQQAYDQIVYHGYMSEQSASPEISERLRELLNKIQGKIIFVYSGTFGSAYDMKIICDVASNLHQQQLNQIHFVIAGNGEGYQRTYEYSKSLPNLSLTGWLNKEELSCLLNHSHVGLLPWNCIRDAMPNKTFEYFSAGLPVISSALGELETLITQGKFGVCYQPGDKDKLQELIILLASNAVVRSELSTNAKAAYKDRFNSDVIYQKYVSYIEEVSKGHFDGICGAR